MTTENKNASRSMWLGLGSMVCCALTGLPAILFGVVALRSGDPNGRWKAWVGIVAGGFFSLMWTGAYLVGSAEREAEEAKARVVAEQQQEAAKVAKKKAEGDAPRRIEEARASITAGKPEAALPTIEWLRSFGIEVPKDLQGVLAKDRLVKAKAAVAEKRWADARTLAGEAKGADAATDAEADQVIAKAGAVLDKAFAVEKAAKKKEEEEKVAAEKKERSVNKTCSQVSRNFGAGSSWSELQKEEQWKGFYEGKEFSWRLEFVEADSLGSGFKVHWKCSPDSPSLIFDLVMTYPKKARAEVMSFEKGRIYKIEGRLKHTGTLMGLTAEPL